MEHVAWFRDHGGLKLDSVGDFKHRFGSNGLPRDAKNQGTPWRVRDAKMGLKKNPDIYRCQKERSRRGLGAVLSVCLPLYVNQIT